MSVVEINANETYTLKGIVLDRFGDSVNRNQTKTRVSMEIPSDVMETMIGVHPPYTMVGEDPENDKAWKAYNRAEVRTMKAGLLEANAAFNFLPADGWELTFSRKAGCSCGCSPAFILKTSTGGFLWIDGKRYKSVWVVINK